MINKKTNIAVKLIIALIILVFEVMVWFLDIDIVGANFFLFTTATLGYFCYLYYTAYNSKTWPSTDGVITKSTYEYREHGKDSHGYTRIVNYEYRVDEKTLTSDAIDFGLNFHDASAKSAYQRDEYKFKKGQKIKVFYHPKKINKAILIPGPQPSLILPIWACIIVILIFVLVYYDLV